MAANWPLRSQASLTSQFVGKTLHDIPLPAAVLDISKVRRNCSKMLEAVDELGADFLAAVSCHRTTEITRLQIGDSPDQVRLLVKSLWEANKLLPLLLDYQIRGAQVNVLYGIPLAPSKVELAAELARQLGRRGGNIRFLVDHISQIKLIERVGELSGYPPRVYILVDIGDCYSGLRPGTPEFQELFSRIEEIVFTEGSPSLDFVGFYSDTTPLDETVDQVMQLRLLDRQLAVLLHASPIETVRLTVRAPPRLWTLLRTKEGPVSREVSKIQHTLVAASEANGAIELHSGEYVLLDVQSLGKDSPSKTDKAPSKHDDIALTVLTEITSLYPRRGENGCLEALVSAGGSAICGQNDDHRGAVSQWNVALNGDIGSSSGWEIDRCRDDSAVLTWRGKVNSKQDFECGQRLRIYPFDAKLAINEFGWFYVVDSTRLGREDEIFDIFVRWRG